MTPPNWYHVDHELTRKVLAGELVDAGSIEQAINFAGDCLLADSNNRDVPHEVYHARAHALVEANESYIEHDDIEEAVRELRRFWSV